MNRTNAISIASSSEPELISSLQKNGPFELRPAKPREKLSYPNPTTTITISEAT